MDALRLPETRLWALVLASMNRLCDSSRSANDTCERPDTRAKMLAGVRSWSAYLEGRIGKAIAKSALD